MYTDSELRTLLLDHFNNIGIIESSSMNWFNTRYNYEDYVDQKPPWGSETMCWVFKAENPDINPFSMAVAPAPKKERPRRVINAN